MVAGILAFYDSNSTKIKVGDFLCKKEYGWSDAFDHRKKVVCILSNGIILMNEVDTTSTFIKAQDVVNYRICA